MGFDGGPKFRTSSTTLPPQRRSALMAMGFDDIGKRPHARRRRSLPSPSYLRSPSQKAIMRVVSSSCYQRSRFANQSLTAQLSTTTLPIAQLSAYAFGKRAPRSPRRPVIGEAASAADPSRRGYRRRRFRLRSHLRSPSQNATTRVAPSSCYRRSRFASQPLAARLSTTTSPIAQLSAYAIGKRPHASRLVALLSAKRPRQPTFHSAAVGNDASFCPAIDLRHRREAASPANPSPRSYRRRRLPSPSYRRTPSESEPRAIASSSCYRRSSLGS